MGKHKRRKRDEAMNELTTRLQELEKQLYGRQDKSGECLFPLTTKVFGRNNIGSYLKYKSLSLHVRLTMRTLLYVPTKVSQELSHEVSQ